MQKLFIALAASMALTVPALAQVVVSAPWVRATVPVQKSTGAFMQLQSPRDARLVGVSSPVADSAEIHQMAMQGDTMKMQEVDGIDLPAGKGVNLASGGYHVMLIGLKRQLKDGDTIPLTLIIENKNKKRDTVTVKVPVKPLTFVSPAGGHAAAH